MKLVSLFCNICINSRNLCELLVSVTKAGSSFSALPYVENIL